MYSANDAGRFHPLPASNLEEEEYRTPWRRDYARLIHSPSFRRLQGKTQLFPSTENDFFRNRLTHSIEVAQIAESIAIRINNRELKGKPEHQIDTSLVEFAGLAHDLGHPPFGHQGEEALDECMRDHGGFEGNAQTLRILTKIEKRHFQPEFHTGFDLQNDKDMRVGMNLTFRTLASILKYDEVIPAREIGRLEYAEQKKKTKDIAPVKGFYESELDIVNRIKESVSPNKPSEKKFKTIECKIMDIADDIAYSTYDLEDGFKAGFYKPLDLIFANEKILSKVSKRVAETLGVEVTTAKIKEVLKDIFNRLFIPTDNLKFEGTELHNFLVTGVEAAYKLSNDIAGIGYHRTILTSRLVGQYIRSIKFTLNTEFPALSDVELSEDVRLQIEVLKRFTYEYQIKSPKLKISEFRGKDIVKSVFEALDSSKGFELLPHDYRELYESTVNDKKRIICDFIAGMTDKYLIEFYGRLTSERPETIFKPI